MEDKHDFFAVAPAGVRNLGRQGYRGVERGEGGRRRGPRPREREGRVAEPEAERPQRRVPAPVLVGPAEAAAHAHVRHLDLVDETATEDCGRQLPEAVGRAKERLGDGVSPAATPTTPSAMAISSALPNHQDETQMSSCRSIPMT